MNRAQKRALAEVRLSLKNTPKEWTFGPHTTEIKESTIRIWISNRYYATEITYGSIHVGGYCFFWWLFPWQWWRVALIREVEDAQYRAEFVEDEENER